MQNTDPNSDFINNVKCTFQPVLVSGVDKCLNRDLWHPRTFSKMFGKQKNDLVNTRNGCLIVGHPMAVFWDGFETYSGKTSILTLSVAL